MGSFFYKMPADLLKTECSQLMLQSKGSLSLFGLTMLMWFTIQETREKCISRSMLMKMFHGISSSSQRHKALHSGFFVIDEETDMVGINQESLHTGGHTGGQPGGQPGAHTPVPCVLKDIDIEGEGEKINFSHTQTKSEIEIKFDQWYAGMKNLQKMKYPLTYKQFEELVRMGFSPLQVRATLERMNNSTSAFQRYCSTFATAKEWLQNPLR